MKIFDKIKNIFKKKELPKNIVSEIDEVSYEEKEDLTKNIHIIQAHHTRLQKLAQII